MPGPGLRSRVQAEGLHQLLGVLVADEQGGAVHEGEPQEPLGKRGAAERRRRDRPELRTVHLVQGDDATFTGPTPHLAQQAAETARETGFVPPG